MFTQGRSTWMSVPSMNPIQFTTLLPTVLLHLRTNEAFWKIICTQWTVDYIPYCFQQAIYGLPYYL